MTLGELCYTNKKGNEVHLGITKHALARLEERWVRLHGEPVPGGAQKWIECNFKNAVRITKPTPALKKRLRKNGGDSMYFRHGAMTFVVQNGTIVTIEISRKGDRLANNSPLPEVRK